MSVLKTIFLASLMVVCSLQTSRALTDIFIKPFRLFDIDTRYNANETLDDVVDAPKLVREGDKITCVAPLVILGTVEPKMAEYHLNDVIQVSCNDGYELESQRSSLLFCTTQGRWKVFSAVEAAALPLPRCMAKQRCPKLPSPVRGSVEYEETGSTGTAKAIYQCNYGLVVDPPESQVRHCVRGKWTGQNPQCVHIGCGKPPPIPKGFYTTRGPANQVHPFGDTVKYSCDTDYQLSGPSILTCTANLGWFPIQLPSCHPVKKSDPLTMSCSTPPQVAGGRYEILPWRNSNSSFIPVFSRATLTCHRGYQLRGSRVITCTNTGWSRPQPGPRCLPVTFIGGSGQSWGNGLHASDDAADAADAAVHSDVPWLVSLTTTTSVILVLSLIWVISRVKMTCRKATTSSCHVTTAAVSRHAVTAAATAAGGSPASSTSMASSASVALLDERRSMWNWIVHPRSADMQDAQRLVDPGDVNPNVITTTSAERDRVTLISYITDSQGILPSYEEVVREPWPLDPPSYESLANCHDNAADESIDSGDRSAVVVADAQESYICPIAQPCSCR